MKRLIVFIIILIGVYAVSGDARERRRVSIAPADTVWGRPLEDMEVIQYLHTDIKIFHGPTAQSVLDYFRAWEDSVDVEIVGAVDMEMRTVAPSDTIRILPVIDLSDTSGSIHSQNEHLAIRGRIFARYVNFSRTKPDTIVNHPNVYYLTVTYRQWREE